MTKRYIKMLWGQLVIETKLFLRDRSSVFWTYFFPVMLILLFGFVFNRPDPIRVSIAFVDLDNSRTSHELLIDLSQVPVIDLMPMEPGEMHQALKNSEKSLAIVVPKGFEERIQKRQPVELQALYNPDQEQVMLIVRPILNQLVEPINWRLAGSSPLISIRPEPIRASRLDYSYISFLVPGLIAFSLMATCLFSIGVVVVSYREKGKLRRLAVTPLPKPIFIGGQILTRYLVVLAQAVLLLILAMTLFEVRINGSLWQFFIGLSLGMLTFISLGYAIASVAKTPETASGIANSLFLPMTFLSGVYFSPDSLPSYLQPLVAILPLTHLVSTIRGIFSHGDTLWMHWPELVILASWMAACLIFSIRKFRWE
jgi:ABC-2 type transport system permease protein